jgi:ubiquinone/menaquinone biosynthesis C-methylase UbiE
VIDRILSPCRFDNTNLVLDLGTGPAIIPLRISQIADGSKPVIYGIDISFEALKLAACVLEIAQVNNVNLLLADCEDLPFLSDSFDYVLSNATFNLLYDKQKGFSEMARITRKGGLVIMGDCVATSCSRINSDDPELWSACVSGAPTEAEIEKLAQQSGFSILKTECLTPDVRSLVSLGLWKWPEFLEHDLDYFVFIMQKNSTFE